LGQIENRTAALYASDDHYRRGAMDDLLLPEVHGSRLALIVGHSLPFDEFVTRADPLSIDVAGTPVELLDTGGFIALPRHGIATFRPAHRIDHRTHIAALAAAGCDRVLALASVGSLRHDWPVGTVVVPDDFMAPQVTPTYHDDARGHSVPGFDPEWRQRVIDTWRAGTTTPIEDGGVYVHTTGPRFETPAEVRMLATFADVVGMTMAAECILAREAGLRYAGLCVVDNLANGLGDALLTEDSFRAGVAANQARLRADLASVVPSLT
jgi:5'-methylthioadenosine phosphorylase